LLKDIITIFYAPLAQVYKAASIADSLGDLQTFINDLIRTVEQVDEGTISLARCLAFLANLTYCLVSQQDPARTVKIFIELVQRHNQAFYNFVHKVHSKGAGLFDNLMRWIELFLTVVREGIGERVSLEYLLPHTGEERTNILREVDAVALYHYRLKVAYESKVRKRFVRGTASNGTSNADEDDQATQGLIDDVVRDFSFGDLVQGDAEDLAAEESESEDGSATESETGSDSEPDSGGAEGSEEGQFPRMASQSPVQLPMPATAHRTEPVTSFDLPSSSRPIVPRQRSLSLHSHKSADLSKTQNAVLAEIPPVPQLPRRNNDIPPTPSSSQPTMRRRKTVADLKRASSKYAGAASHKTSKKKQAPDIKPPDLKAIPDLLPLFVEMVSRSDVIDQLFFD
jgi:Domain of unknown function in PX-proteins (DUF3818)